MIQIHVVQSGDSLWTIARDYGTTVENLVTANQIPEPDRLVVGQALVVPITGQFYIVRPGDSLWSIGQRFGINYVTLAQINNIQLNSLLMIGTPIYIPPLPKTSAQILAYIEPRGEEVSEALISRARKRQMMLKRNLNKNLLQMHKE